MDIGLDQNVDAANAVEIYFHVRVIPPVTHFRHVFASRVVLLVACETKPSLAGGTCRV